MVAFSVYRCCIFCVLYLYPRWLRSFLASFPLFDVGGWALASTPCSSLVVLGVEPGQGGFPVGLCVFLKGGCL